MLRFLWDEIQRFEEEQANSPPLRPFSSRREWRRVIDQGDNIGQTPLETAFRKRYYDVAKMLLEFGANPNGNDCHSGLFSAISREDIGAVRLLLENGADPDLAIYLKGTALHYAVNNLNLKKTELSRRLVICLLEYGANPMVFDGITVKICPLKERYTEYFHLVDVYFSEARILQLSRNVLPQPWLRSSEFLESRVDDDDEDEPTRGNKRLSAFIYARTGNTPIQLNSDPSISAMLKLFANARAVFPLLVLARIVLSADRHDCVLLPDLLKMILSRVYRCLTPVQSAEVITFASNKRTLGTTKRKFFRQTMGYPLE